MSNSEKKIILVRHGETPWTITRQHTGLTDLPLTQKGMTDCLFIKKALLPYAPQHIFTSPL
ncbi:MAG: phosphoglycerate mutase family protein, partial [Rhabdochlamydiaceae bacterium]